MLHSTDNLIFDQDGLLVSMSQFVNNEKKRRMLLSQEIEELTDLLKGLRSELDILHDKMLAMRKNSHKMTYTQWLAFDEMRLQHGLILRNIMLAQKVLLHVGH